MASADVLLLAAGYGTRLHPLTRGLPKALLPLYGRPLLDLHLERLFEPGIAGFVPGAVVVNGHHCADLLGLHLASHPHAEQLVFSREPEILGTGGAIRHAARWLGGETLMVMNADALCKLPGPAALAAHAASGRPATMVLTPARLHPNVRVSGDRVTAILRDRVEQDALTYTGICLLSPAFLDCLPPCGFHDLRDAFDPLIAAGEVGAWIAPADPPLLDIGTPRRYLDAHRACTPARAVEYGLRLPAATGTAAEEYGWIDGDARVGGGAVVRRSVVLALAEIAAGVVVEDAIVGPDVRVRESLREELVTAEGRLSLRS